MKKTLKFTAAGLALFLLATSASAEVLVYDGFPVGEGGYAATEQNPTDKGKITHADVVGFKSDSWSANNTSVIYTLGSAYGLELPVFASAVTKGTAVGTAIGCHNTAASNTSYERVKYRPLADGKFSVEAVGESDKLHVRMLLKADEAALKNLQKDASDENPITANNWYGAGFFYAEKAPAGGTHNLLRMAGRALWFGLIKDKNGDLQVIMNVRGWGTQQDSTVVTLCTASPNETYLCYAEIKVNANGADQVRAFAMPTGDWSVANAQQKLENAQTTVTSYLIDKDKPLNYLVVGGAYCTNNGRFAADEIGVATDAQDLIDLIQNSESVYFSKTEITGTPVEGITARAVLGNPPASFSMDCYIARNGGDFQLVKTWSNQTSENTSWECPVENPQWGETYSAKFVMTAGEKTLESRVVSCSPSTTITWTGEASDNVWETAKNWNPALVPTATLDAVFATAAADVTHTGSDSVRSLGIEGGSKVVVNQAKEASLAADSLAVTSGYGNKFTIDGGSFSVKNDTTLGTGRTSDNRYDQVLGSNGDVIELKNGEFTLNKIKLFGNTYDAANRFIVTNATVQSSEVETVYDQNLSQGNVSFEAYDSTINNTSHFQLNGMGTTVLFQDCTVLNDGVLRLGQGASAPNEMRLYGTEWTQTAREVILGRKGSQYLEIGTGSSFTVKKGTETASGNILIGHGGDGGGTGTLVVSNATLTVEQNLHIPQDQRYDKQYVRLYATDGKTASINCKNIYVGTTGYNGSSNKRTPEQASEFTMNGGTINCTRYLNIGAVHETGGNRLSITGPSAHCMAGLFALTNASTLAIQIPDKGFNEPALIEVKKNADDAQGIATLSADSSIEIDTTEYKGDTVTLTLIKAVKIDSALTAEEIAAKITSRRNQKCKVWFEVDDQGEKVALQMKVSKVGTWIIIR